MKNYFQFVFEPRKWNKKKNYINLHPFSLVMVIPRLTSIQVQWNQLSYRNDRLKIILENSFHRREVACDGNLGRKLVSHINPGICYNLTIFKTNNKDEILKSDKVFLSTNGECFLLYLISFLDILQRVGRPSFHATNWGILCEWRPSPGLPAELEDLLYIFRVAHEGDKVTHSAAPVGQGSVNLTFPVGRGIFPAEILFSFPWLREMWPRLQPIGRIRKVTTGHCK